MQENIFKKVMNVAEIDKLNREERAAYEHSLKNYRDLQNVKDTYFEEGILEGEKRGKKGKERRERRRNFRRKDRSRHKRSQTRFAYGCNCSIHSIIGR